METGVRPFNPPKGSFFPFGPRGTGKSTFVRRRFERILYLDLLDPERVRSLPVRPCPDFVVIDEVQRLPELLPAVHGLIEGRRRKTFVLTGSSTRSLAESPARSRCFV